MTESIFILDPNAVIVDEEGFYHGHTLLAEKRNSLQVSYENLFIGSLDPREPNNKIVKDYFFRTFQKEYLLAQKKLAQEHLLNQAIDVYGDLDKKTLSNIQVVDVLERPGSDVLFSLSFPGFHSSAIISKEMKIQILGDIPKG